MVNLFQYAIVNIKGRVYRLGSIDVPIPVVELGEGDYGDIDIAPETTVTLFDVATGRLDQFDFAWIQTDFDVMLELITDDGNDIGQEEATLELKGTGTANKLGPALILGSDASYAGYTTNFGAGTLDKIEKILARNLSESNTASVRVFFGKAAA